MTAAFIIRVAPVADRDVKKSIRPEGDATGVMVHVRLVDLEQHALGRGIHPAWVIRRHFEFRNPQGRGVGRLEIRSLEPIRRCIRTQRGAVSQIDLVILFEARVQRQAEQSSFVKTVVEFGHSASGIEERLIALGAVFRQHRNDADLVRDKQPSRTILQWDQCRRRGEPFGKHLQANAGRAVGRRGGSDRKQKKTENNRQGRVAGNKVGFHAADCSGFFGDNKGFAARSSSRLQISARKSGWRIGSL